MNRKQLKKFINFILLFGILIGGLPAIVLADPSATLTSSSTVNLKTGESTIVKFNTYNDKSFCTITAYYSLDSTSYNGYIGSIPPGNTKSVSFQIYAPPQGSGSGSITHIIYVKFVTDKSFWCGGEIYTPPGISFVINYDDSEYQQQLEAEQQRQAAASSAYNAINSAQGAISSAYNAIVNAQSAISSAKANGADVSEAEIKLTNAQSSYDSASSKISSANSEYNSGSYELATSLANEASNYANSAKSDADSAYTSANIAKQNAISAKNDASVAIDKAKTQIDSANSAINSAESSIINSTVGYLLS